jgi:hypothetical protein
LKEKVIARNANVTIMSKKHDCNGMNLTEVDYDDQVLAVYGIPHLWDIGKKKIKTFIY